MHAWIADAGERHGGEGRSTHRPQGPLEPDEAPGEERDHEPHPTHPARRHARGIPGAPVARLDLRSRRGTAVAKRPGPTPAGSLIMIWSASCQRSSLRCVRPRPAICLGEFTPVLPCPTRRWRAGRSPNTGPTRRSPRGRRPTRMTKQATPITATTAASVPVEARSASTASSDGRHQDARIQRDTAGRGAAHDPRDAPTAMERTGRRPDTRTDPRRPPVARDDARPPSPRPRPQRRTERPPDAACGRGSRPFRASPTCGDQQRRADDRRRRPASPPTTPTPSRPRRGCYRRDRGEPGEPR